MPIYISYILSFFSSSSTLHASLCPLQTEQRHTLCVYLDSTIKTGSGYWGIEWLHATFTSAPIVIFSSPDINNHSRHLYTGFNLWAARYMWRAVPGLRLSTVYDVGQKYWHVMQELTTLFNRCECASHHIKFIGSQTDYNIISTSFNCILGTVSWHNIIHPDYAENLHT